MIDSGGWQRRRIIWDVSTGMNMITFPDPVGNGLLAQEDETGEYLLYHFNNIGSTSALTDMDGTIVHAYSYGTYGELLSGNREGIRFLYNGRYGVVTDENGLYYMRARYYNVDIKRFINQDVVEGSIATSPSLNQYAYCQGNPVKLTDPFGLSPFTSWSVLGHGLLDILGFIPVIGAIPDTVNALWYLAEGDHFSAAASFVSAVPGWGDVIGAVGKTAKGCSKVSKMVRYGSKIVGRIGNIALGSYQTGSIAVSLYDKHVVQGESWDWDSTVQLFSAGLFATTTVVSAKGLANDLSNYSSVKYDIQTSQCFVEGTLVLTKEGNKPIEEIQAGDLVYATNPETGGSGYKEVLRTFRKESDVLIHVFVNGEEIETTAVHPFWVENRWVSAKDLKEGDLLTLADGSVARISGVYGEKLDEAVVVYNFEVEEFHTYYVTDTGILVHNANPAGGCGVTGNKSGTETELFLPDEFYNKNLPSQVTPGTKYLPKYDEVGNVKQIKMYDDYGREIGWVDYTNHGFGNINSPHYHTTPHWHEKIYNAQYPDGIKINHRIDINTPLGDK